MAYATDLEGQADEVPRTVATDLVNRINLVPSFDGGDDFVGVLSPGERFGRHAGKDRAVKARNHLYDRPLVKGRPFFFSSFTGGRLSPTFPTGRGN